VSQSGPRDFSVVGIASGEELTGLFAFSPYKSEENSSHYCEPTGLMKVFIMHTLFEKNTGEKSRLKEVEYDLARILGVRDEPLRLIKKSIAYAVYKTLIINKLGTTTSLEGPDFKTLAFLKDDLNLDTSSAELILHQASTGKLFFFIRTIACG
jgi:hypothetical protein